MSASEDRLFKEEVLEVEGNELLNKMSGKDLTNFLDEISDNIASNASFAAELSYWQGLSRKVRHKVAVKKIEALYRLFVKKNKANIERIREIKRAQQLQEESKGLGSSRVRKTIVKLNLAEKIKKTALNTGIRFNIVDNYGFDNASMQMFQDAQKQGMNADEQEFADLITTENAQRANKQLLMESEE